MANRTLNLHGLNLHGLNIRPLARGWSILDGGGKPAPAPPTPTGEGAYMVTSGGGWQKYMLADGKYYIVKT